MSTPTATPRRRLMMISLHGYVSAKAEIGLPDTGGQVVYVLRLSEQLARLGHAVDIFTRRFEGQAPIEQVAPDVRIVRIAAGGDDLIRKEWMHAVVPEWVDRAAAWVREQGLAYELIDSHYWDAGLAGDALAGLLAIPHIHTPHSLGAWKRASMDGDAEELERQYNFRRRIRDEARIMRSAARVIATSPQQRDLIAGAEYRIPASDIAIVPPGYDPVRFHPVPIPERDTARREAGFQGPTVLALGRVAANKGYDLLVRAMRTVADRVPDARLVLAVGSTRPTPGEARQIEELRELAGSLGLADVVELRDYIPEQQLVDTYRAADVFVLSSRYEPFGMTAVEAMACGTPTVITTQGGLWQMINWGRDAICADPNDTEAFGHAIAAILTHPGIAAEIGAAGALRAFRSFTWEHVAHEVLRAVPLAETPISTSGGSKGTSGTGMTTRAPKGTTGAPKVAPTRAPVGAQMGAGAGARSTTSTGQATGTSIRALAGPARAGAPRKLPNSTAGPRP